MRILVIQPTGDKMGHYGIYTSRVCQELARVGHAVTLCTNEIHPERYLNEPLSFRIERVGQGRLTFDKFDEVMATKRWLYYWGYFRNSYRVTSEGLRLATSGDFDLVLVLDAEFLMASLALRKNRFRLPPVVMYVSAANFSFRDYAGSIPKKVYKVFQREIFRRTLGSEIRGLSILGGWHEKRLRSQLRLPSTYPIIVVPDGAGQPAASLGRAEARKRLSLDYSGSLLLFFGILRKDKGIETLIRAIDKVKNEDFRVLIAGFPMDYTDAEIRELVRNSGIEDRVILKLGYVAEEDVAAHFGAADALVLPYSRIYTGGSGPLMKGACTYGKPIIASDVSEMGGLVRKHGLGWVSMPDDPKSLADGIRGFLATSEGERQRLATQALALGQQNSWSTMAERFTKLFESVLSKTA